MIRCVNQLLLKNKVIIFHLLVKKTIVQYVVGLCTQLEYVCQLFEFSRNYLIYPLPPPSCEELFHGVWTFAEVFPLQAGLYPGVLVFFVDNALYFPLLEVSSVECIGKCHLVQDTITVFIMH